MSILLNYFELSGLIASLDNTEDRKVVLWSYWNVRKSMKALEGPLNWNS